MYLITVFMLKKTDTIRIPYFFAVMVLTSCASVKVKELSKADARPGNCQLPVFTDVIKVNGTFEVVCEIESRTGAALYVKRTPEAAIERAKSAACRCGADAILVTKSGKTNLKFFSWRRGTATLQAIKINRTAFR